MHFFEVIWAIILVIGRIFLIIFMLFALLMTIFSLKDGEYVITVISVIMFLFILWAYMVNFKKRKIKVGKN